MWATALICLLSQVEPWLQHTWSALGTCLGFLQAEASEQASIGQCSLRAQPSHTWVGWCQILPVPHLNQSDKSDKAVITASRAGLGKSQGALNSLERLGAQQDCDCLDPCTSDQGNVRPLWVTSLIALKIIWKLHDSDTKPKKYQAASVSKSFPHIHFNSSTYLWLRTPNFFLCISFAEIAFYEV